MLGGFVKCYIMLGVHIQNWNFIKFNQYLVILSFILKWGSIYTQYFAEQLAGVDRCDVYTNVHLWLILRLPNDQEKSFTFGFKLKKTIFVVYFLASIPTLYSTSIFWIYSLYYLIKVNFVNFLWNLLLIKNIYFLHRAQIGS